MFLKSILPALIIITMLKALFFKQVQNTKNQCIWKTGWKPLTIDYLKMTRRDILTSSGRISHKQAIEKAHAEYDKYKNRLDDTLSPVEKDFIENIGMLEQITDSSKK